MFHQLPTACVEWCIATSRLVSLSISHNYSPFLTFVIVMFRSRHAVSRTAIPVSMVVHWMSPCKTCARSPLSRCRQLIGSFLQDSGSRGTNRQQPQSAHPGLLSVFNSTSTCYSATDRSRAADDKVQQQDAEEAALFRLLGAVTQHSAASLSTRWREPALTIHSVRGSGPHSALTLFHIRSCIITEYDGGQIQL